MNRATFFENGTSSRPYWTPSSQLGGESVNFWAKGRSGLTMIDSVAGNNVTLTTPTHRSSAGASLTGTKTAIDRLLDGSSYTIYFKLIQINNDTSENILEFGNGLGVHRGLVFFNNGGAFTALISDGTLYSQVAQIANCNTTLKPAGWIEVFAQVDFAAKLWKCNLYKYSDGSSLGTPISASIATWTFNTNDNYAAFQIMNTAYGYADIKKFNALKTIAQCRDNTYSTDLQYYYPTVIDGTDVSASAHHLTRVGITGTTNKYYSNVSTYCLDNGYSLYRSRYADQGTYKDVRIPYSLAGVPIARTLEALPEYASIEDHAGSLTEHNKADSRLNIPVASWDKVSTTIFVDGVRSSSFYDATNTDEWHIDELDLITFSQNCKTNHNATNFFKKDGYLSELFSFANDKLSHVNRINQYTGKTALLASCIKLNYDATLGLATALEFATKDLNSSISIYWGEGDRVDVKESTFTQSSRIINKTYGSAAVFPVYILNPQNLGAFDHRTGIGATRDLSPTGGNIGEFNKATNLTYLGLSANVTPWVGTINGLAKSITKKVLYGCELVTGQQNLFPLITHLDCNYACDSDISNLTGMVYLRLNGPNCTMTFDVTGWNSIEHLDNQYAINVYASGSLAGKTSFKFICWGMANGMTGDLSGCINIEEMSTGGSHFSGSINGWTKCGVLVSKYSTSPSYNTFTGSLLNLPDLADLQLDDSSTITKPTTLVSFKKLFRFKSSIWALTTANQNQYLADFITNKDEAKGDVAGITPIRDIDLTGTLTTDKPTGQGLTDAAALRLYRSPNNNVAYPVWTVTVNT
jgi:hypothetical protein